VENGKTLTRNSVIKHEELTNPHVKWSLNMFEGENQSIAGAISSHGADDTGDPLRHFDVKVMMETCSSAQKLAERAAYDLKATQPL
jgi:hypothetical protein